MYPHFTRIKIWYIYTKYHGKVSAHFIVSIKYGKCNQIVCIQITETIGNYLTFD